MKCLEESIGLNLHNLGVGKEVLGVTPKHKQQKKKVDFLMFIKIENFFTLKYIIKKVKRQHRRGKIFTNHFSGMELVSRYIKNSYSSIIKRQSN